MDVDGVRIQTIDAGEKVTSSGRRHDSVTRMSELPANHHRYRRRLAPGSSERSGPPLGHSYIDHARDGYADIEFE